MKLALSRIARRSLAACAVTAVAPAIAQFPPLVSLKTPSSIERVRFDCPGNGVGFSSAIAGIGDINADGIDDFAIGAPNWSTPSETNAGACFVYFGGAWTAGTATFDVTALNGTNGFVVVGDGIDDLLGSKVSGAGDVNGDGIADLLIADAGLADAAGNSHGMALVLFGGPGVGSSGTITPAMLDGSNGFRIIGPTFPPGTPGAGVVSAAAAIGDVNADGFADVAIGNQYLGSAQPTLALPVGLSRGITAADFDGDGDDDLVVSHENQNRYTLFRNLGGGSFSPLSFVSASRPRKVMSADIDHDGDIDLVFVTQQASAPFQARITVVKNLGGLFTTGVNYLLSGMDADFDLGDIDGDTFVDIVAVSYTFPNDLPRELVTLINDQSGAFALQQTLLPAKYPVSVRLGDLDGDGDLDAAVYQQGVIKLKFFANDGTGALSPVGVGDGMSLASQGLLAGFEFGDADRDGDLDVFGGEARVMRNDGAFTFTILPPASPPGTLGAVLIHDFDGDGDVDELMGMNGTGYSFAFCLGMNSGNGTFSATRRFAAPLTSITGGALIDFDGDGSLDVAALGTAGVNQTGLVLIHSNGDGTFAGDAEGRAWVVYGASAVAAPGDLMLAGLDGSNGFRIEGRASNEGLGGTLGSAGDIDHDGTADFALGASAAWMGGVQPGAAFVVRGATGLGAGGVLQVHTAPAASVFAVVDATPDTSFPACIAGGGDLDGDGIDDLALGAYVSSGGVALGGVYVVFGATTVGSAGQVSLANPDGMYAFKLQEQYSGMGIGFCAAIAGDVNASGRRDLIASAWHWPLNGAGIQHGLGYVLYGKPRPYAAGIVNASNLNGNNGFKLEGDLQDYALFGATVAGVGDVDDDGVDDFLIGEPGWDPAAASSQFGRAWLVLGGKYIAPQTYCTSKTNSLGCEPSIGWTGALPSVTDPDPFVVTSTNTINQRFGLLFYGVAGRSATPFLGGTLCVQPPLRRTPIASSGGNLAPDDCSGMFSFDWRAWMISGSDPSLLAGTTVDAQFWSRDPPSSFSVNLSNALEFLIGV